jgi:hypothetical protein
MSLKKGLSKKGQITIFLIIAVVIISAVIVFFNLYPKFKANFSTGQKTPSTFIQDCIQDKIKETSEKVGMRGGSINPENSILYNNTNVEYLCYTNERDRPCVVQQPLLVAHMEREMKDALENDVKLCFNSMAESYTKSGYKVNVKEGEVKFELQPKKIISTFNYSVSMNKGQTQNYEDFMVVIDNNLYELAMIAMSIMEWESTYGDAYPEIYMKYYHNLVVEKQAAGGGAIVYVIRDINTKNKLQFAVRSRVWASGLATPTQVK